MKLEVGVPLIVTMFPEVIAVIPTGRPVIFILVAPPPKVYSIGVIALPVQIDWMSVSCCWC